MLVAFLGQAVQWTGDINIIGLGLGTAGVVFAVGFLTYATARKRD